MVFLYSDLKNKTIVIIGGSSGVGRAIALRFAIEHAKIIFNYLRSSETAEEVPKEISKLGGETFYIQGNVSKKGDVKSLKNLLLNNVVD